LLRHSWLQEVEADDVGTTIMLKAEADDSDPVRRSFLGLEVTAPVLFFKYVDVLDKSIFVLNNGTNRPEINSKQIGEMKKNLKRWSEASTSGRTDGGARRGGLDGAQMQEVPL
jgi:hypothetical protein